VIQGLVTINNPLMVDQFPEIIKTLIKNVPAIIMVITVNGYMALP